MFRCPARSAVSHPKSQASSSANPKSEAWRVSNHGSKKHRLIGRFHANHFLWFQDVSSQDFSEKLMSSAGTEQQNHDNKMMIDCRGEVSCHRRFPTGFACIIFQNFKSMANPVTSLSTSFYIYRPPISPPFQVIPETQNFWRPH